MAREDSDRAENERWQRSHCDTQDRLWTQDLEDAEGIGR